MPREASGHPYHLASFLMLDDEVGTLVDKTSG